MARRRTRAEGEAAPMGSPLAFLALLALLGPRPASGASGAAALKAAFSIDGDARLMRVGEAPNSAGRLIRVEDRARELAAEGSASFAGGGFERESSATVPRSSKPEVDPDHTAGEGDPVFQNLLQEYGAPTTKPPDVSCYNFVSAVNVPSKTKCPDGCPYWAEAAMLDESCDFKCVKGDECGAWGEGIAVDATIPDKMGYCKRCTIPHCAVCRAHENLCAECVNGFFTLMDGHCQHKIQGSLVFFGLVLGTLSVVSIAWYIDLRCRPAVNQEELDKALAHRSRSKLHLPCALPASALKEVRDEEGAGEGSTAAATGGGVAPATGGGATPGEDNSAAAGGGAAEERPLWPLATNLLTVPAGGPGCTLLFRFQIFWIVWAVVGCGLFFVLSHSFNSEVFQLGIRDMDTPQDLCRAVYWGYQLQHSAAPMKVKFCALFYFASVVMSITFEVMQLRHFHDLDKYTTMKDFAAFITGIPELKGTEKVETELAEVLQAQTGQKVVGVSVGWDIVDKLDDVMVEVHAELERTGENRSDGAPGGAPPAAAQSGGEGAAAPLVPGEGRPLTVMEENGWRWKYLGLIDRILYMVQDCAPPNEESEAKSEEAKAKELEKLVTEMQTTPFGFVVFESEEAKAKAILAIKEKNGFYWKEGHIELEARDNEPEAIRWSDIGYPIKFMVARIFKAILQVLIALLCWLAFFYVPYMYHLSSFHYDASHQEPDGYAILLLTGIIAGGNVMIYTVCSFVTERIGFHFEEQREACYMIMYFVAVLFNVVLDLVCSSWISYQVMIGAHAHTFGGAPLDSVSGLLELYETYPIQKSLGYQLFLYAFPATFLTPYLAEPLGTIWLPYHIQRMVVGSNPALKGWRAERAMSILVPQDTGRYADVLINIVLVVMVFFVPMGWTLRIFAGLIVSHIYIYAMDHYRVLRCVPGFTWSTEDPALLASKLSVVPIGLILVACMLKANCMEGSYCMKGPHLAYMLGQTFFLHCFVHVLLLWLVAPRLAGSRACDDERTSVVQYEAFAKATPASYFNTNPAHCLRSKHVYKHSPPCHYYVRGNEHRMSTNPEAGQHFNGPPVAAEKY